MTLRQPLIPNAELVRFSVVTALGLVIDIILAWSLSEILLINIVLASAAGFVIGAGFNYILHQAWTFQRARDNLPPQLLMRYCLILGATLATRLGVVYGLGQNVPETQNTFIVLALAISMSFIVNYLGNKFFVFKRVLVPNSSNEDNQL